MKRVSLITLLATAVLSSVAVGAQQSGKVWWPQFRGPNSSGLGEGKPPVNFGPDQNVLWKTAVGPGLSSPIIWGERIFLTEFDRENKRLSTLCIDRRTGKILWRRTVAPEKIEEVHAISSPAGATPVTDGERVYVYFGSYGLLCYDLNGNLKWERRLPIPENPYGAVASPILAGEFLVLNHQGKDAYLLAVNRRDGRTVWKTDRSKFQYGWSTPVHWRHDGSDEIWPRIRNRALQVGGKCSDAAAARQRIADQRNPAKRRHVRTSEMPVDSGTGRPRKVIDGSPSVCSRAATGAAAG